MGFGSSNEMDANLTSRKSQGCGTITLERSWALQGAGGLRTQSLQSGGIFEQFVCFFLCRVSPRSLLSCISFPSSTHACYHTFFSTDPMFRKPSRVMYLARVIVSYTCCRSFVATTPSSPTQKSLITLPDKMAGSKAHVRCMFPRCFPDPTPLFPKPGTRTNRCSLCSACSYATNAYSASGSDHREKLASRHSLIDFEEEGIERALIIIAEELEEGQEDMHGHLKIHSERLGRLLPSCGRIPQGFRIDRLSSWR